MIQHSSRRNRGTSEQDITTDLLTLLKGSFNGTCRTVYNPYNNTNLVYPETYHILQQKAFQKLQLQDLLATDSVAHLPSLMLIHTEPETPQPGKG